MPNQEKDNMESKSVMKRVAVQTKSEQEKICKWLGIEQSSETAFRGDGTRDGVKEVVISVDPDLSTPDGMVMILGRLVEMGYEWTIHSPEFDGYYFGVWKKEVIKGYSADEVTVKGDTPPLAVLAAVESLMKKEEKE